MDVDIFYNGEFLNRNKLKESWISINLPDVYNIIKSDNSIEYLNFSQRLYHYINKLTNYPICDYCGVYNKRWKSFTTGYKVGCCRGCSISLSRPKSNITRRNNAIEKWGVDHTSKVDEVKKKVEKTNLERYGCKAPAMNRDIKDKMLETNRIKFGVDYPLQNEKIYKKYKETIEFKYGVDNLMKSDLVKNNVRNTNLRRYGVESYSSTDTFKNKLSELFYNRSLGMVPDHIERLEIIDNDFRINCKNCGEESLINRSLFYLRLNRYKTDVCLNCNPLYNNFVSSHEQKLSKFLKVNNINHICSYRDNYELDILLPNFNIGIEVNGTYWHSELFKDKDYHIKKKEYFKERGIDVIQIWEDDWLYKQDIVKSIILSRLNKSNRKIWARKCDIRVVSIEETKEFLDVNHLQGYVASSIKYGLYQNDELLCLSTFSKRKFIKNNDWELVRFCNKLGVNVVGGFSKLLKYFTTNNKFESITSYAKCDITSIDSNVYLKNGFNYDSFTGVGYFWCKGLNRFNRYNFRKDKLVKMGYGSNKTESEIMYGLKFFKCFDSGNYKYVYTKKLVPEEGVEPTRA